MSLISKYENKMNVISKTLRKYRLERNLSYEQLSAKLELLGIIIHKQSLYDIEINKRTVKDYELCALAHILGIDVKDLLAEMKKSIEKI